MKQPMLLTLLCVTVVSVGVTATPTKPSSIDELLRKLSILAEIFEVIENHYVETPPTQDLIYGAANGIVQALDSHSSFLAPHEHKKLVQGSTGEYAGVGLELNFDVSPPEVISVVTDSPAAFAGIRAGDRILKIANQDANNLSYNQATELIRGDVGTRLELYVQRQQSEQAWRFTLIRNWIRAVPLEHKVLGDGIHYVKIRNFARGVGYELRSKLKSQDSLRGLILDLRDNPGGIFDEAVNVSDLFLEKGTIVSALGRNDKVLSRQEATQEVIAQNLPLFILINRSSASASEIVAGALQDNNRARLFGEKTYGKGSVQTIVKLSDGSGIKLTVARYRTPKGKMIDGVGIVPDVLIPRTANKDDTFDAALRWMRKKGL